MAEFQRRKTVLRVSATRCCKLPNRGVREYLPRTDDHAVAEYYVVVLEVPEVSAEWCELPQNGTGGRESFQQKCYIVELDRTTDEQLDGC